MDNLVDQAQSLFYNDVHFNSVNTRIHTEIECKTPGGKVSRETFKVDTIFYANFHVHVTIPQTQFGNIE